MSDRACLQSTALDRHKAPPLSHAITLFESLTRPGTFMSAISASSAQSLRQLLLLLFSFTKVETEALDGKLWNNECTAVPLRLSSSCSSPHPCHPHVLHPQPTSWECSHLPDPPGASAPVLGGLSSLYLTLGLRCCSWLRGTEGAGAAQLKL